MRASVGAFAIFMATISCCASTALAKSTAATAAVDTNTKTRLRRRAQRNVIDVQIPEKNNLATKDDEMALFELETAQFANRFLQQSGSNGRKRNRVSDDETSASSESEESEESEDESVEEDSTPVVDDFAPASTPLQLELRTTRRKRSLPMPRILPSSSPRILSPKSPRKRRRRRRRKTRRTTRPTRRRTPPRRTLLTSRSNRPPRASPRTAPTSPRTSVLMPSASSCPKSPILPSLTTI